MRKRLTALVLCVCLVAASPALASPLAGGTTAGMWDAVIEWILDLVALPTPAGEGTAETADGATPPTHCEPPQACGEGGGSIDPNG